MKKIVKLVFLVLSLLGLLAACSKPEQEVVTRKALKVLSSEVIIGVEGGEGSILVDADDAVTATSERSWCQVTVDGKTIKVSVPEPNKSRMSRYSRIIIKAGSDESHVTVQQYGEVFSGMNLEDVSVGPEGATFRYSYLANMDVRLSSDQPWVHFEKEEGDPDVMKVIVDAHAGFGYRIASVSYTAGSNTGTAQVVQEPTYGEVSGWKVEDLNGRFVFPDQIDNISITPSSDLASAPYFWDVVDPSEFAGVTDVAAKIREQAENLKEQAQAGEITFTKGGSTREFTNLPSTAKAVIILFDDRNYPTGQYALVDVAVPDRGPVKKLVDGWEIVHTGATYAHPVQTDQFTVTPKAGYEDVKYIATVVDKASVVSVEDYAFTTFAMDTREEILAKVASGELPSFEAGLLSGTSTIEAEDKVGEVYVFVVAFGENQFYTGDYQVSEFTLPDATPAFYKWIGKWNVSRKNDKYDDIDTWEITVKKDGETLQIVGIESFSDPERHYAEATVDEEGRLVLKTHYTGSYEDSSRGHVDVLLSGQYDDTKAGKTYYTSSLNVVLFRGTLSEDGKTADLEPGLINGYYFKNIQFYGRYKNSSGGTSAVTWNAGPTQIPQTITRVVE